MGQRRIGMMPDSKRARERRRETLGGRESRRDDGKEKKSIRVRWQQRRERGHKSPKPILCVPIL